jgi:hypothetical protein
MMVTTQAPLHGGRTIIRQPAKCAERAPIQLSLGGEPFSMLADSFFNSLLVRSRWCDPVIAPIAIFGLRQIETD